MVSEDTAKLTTVPIHRFALPNSLFHLQIQQLFEILREASEVLYRQ